MLTPFRDTTTEPAIDGFLHIPERPNANGDGVVLAHGAGADCRTKLLTAISDALADHGFTVLRFDLPFRLARPHGPPSPATAGRDREGLRRAATLMKQKVTGRVFLGGHSYGGRQTTILLSEEPNLVHGLLLLSYPLHPPRKPDQLRTSHFPKLSTPAFFVHGTRDPFGSIKEMQAALKLLPGPHKLQEVPNAGHELLPKTGGDRLLKEIAGEFILFQSEFPMEP
jgi:uncharacterized protein